MGAGADAVAEGPGGGAVAEGGAVADGEAVAEGVAAVEALGVAATLEGLRHPARAAARQLSAIGERITSDSIIIAA
jgi:hypothetical protein